MKEAASEMGFQVGREIEMERNQAENTSFGERCTSPHGKSKPSQDQQEIKLQCVSFKGVAFRPYRPSCFFFFSQHSDHISKLVTMPLISNPIPLSSALRRWTQDSYFAWPVGAFRSLCRQGALEGAHMVEKYGIHTPQVGTVTDLALTYKIDGSHTILSSTPSLRYVFEKPMCIGRHD